MAITEHFGHRLWGLHGVHYLPGNSFRWRVMHGRYPVCSDFVGNAQRLAGHYEWCDRGSAYRDVDGLRTRSGNHLHAREHSVCDPMVGMTSVSRTLTVADLGNIALSINSISTTGDFSETHDCGASLAVSQTCSISITFAHRLRQHEPAPWQWPITRSAVLIRWLLAVLVRGRSWSQHRHLYRLEIRASIQQAQRGRSVAKFRRLQR